MKIMVASLTPVRLAALKSIRPALGLECECIVTKSMPVEPDFEPVVVAQHKALHVLDRLTADGYTDRRDGRYTFIFAADCENRGEDGILKGKPDSPDRMALFVDEWERAARREAMHSAHSGYALLVCHAYRAVMYTQTDMVCLYPKSQTIVRQSMYPVEDRFYDHGHIAHGFPTERAIREGQLVVTDASGRELTGIDAAYRAQGASPLHIFSLFAAAYADLVK